MLNKETNTTRKSSTPSSLALDKWLRILSANFRVDLSPLQIEAYRVGLSDLTPEQLHVACSKALAEITDFMPTVGKIRSYVDDKQKQTDNLAAEQEWDRIVKHIYRFGAQVFPSDTPLALTPAGEYALRQVGWRAGVMDALASEDSKKLHFAKQNFVKAHSYHAETGGLQALSRGEAREMLESARKQVESARPKLLPAKETR